MTMVAVQLRITQLLKVIAKKASDRKKRGGARPPRHPLNPPLKSKKIINLI